MTTKINPSEISSIIKKKIDGYKGAATEANVGEVLTTADGIVQIFGLEDAMYGELLDFGEGTYGLALNLENDSVGAVVLGDSGHIKEGQKVKTTGRVLDVPVGEGLKGRVIDDKFINFKILKEDNEINIFFDNINYNLIGWQIASLLCLQNGRYIDKH